MTASANRSLLTTENTVKPILYAPLLALAVLAGCSDYKAPTAFRPGRPRLPPPPPAFATFQTLGDSISIAAKLAEFRPRSAVR
jgi:hypothetical protein